MARALLVGLGMMKFFRFFYAVPVVLFIYFLTFVNSTHSKLSIGNFSMIFSANLGVRPNFWGKKNHFVNFASSAR